MCGKLGRARSNIWNNSVLVLNLCQQAFKSYGLSRVMHEERKMVGSDIQLQIAHIKIALFLL